MGYINPTERDPAANSNARQAHRAVAHPGERHVPKVDLRKSRLARFNDAADKKFNKKDALLVMGLAGAIVTSGVVIKNVLTPGPERQRVTRSAALQALERSRSVLTQDVVIKAGVHLRSFPDKDFKGSTPYGQSDLGKLKKGEEIVAHMPVETGTGYIAFLKPGVKTSDIDSMQERADNTVFVDVATIEHTDDASKIGRYPIDAFVTKDGSLRMSFDASGFPNVHSTPKNTVGNFNANDVATSVQATAGSYEQYKGHSAR